MASEFIITQWRAEIRNSIFMLAVLATVWTLAVFFAPWSLVRIALNIGFFLFTLAGAAVVWSMLRQVFGAWLGWFIAMLIWGVSVLLVRSLELAVLEAVFRAT